MKVSHGFLLVFHLRMLPVGITEKARVMTVSRSFAELPCFMRGDCVVFMPYPSTKHSALYTSTANTDVMINFVCQLE